jgi:hypothetical protein
VSASPLRVSVRPDFDALDVPTDGPARTPDGRAWVRWAKYGSHSGWYAVGARKPKLSGQPKFWEAVFSVACACAGGNVDQAHCCGRGILALGGLGVTMRSGYAQLLLHCCLLKNPVRYVEIMAPVIGTTLSYTKASEQSPSGVAFHDSMGGPWWTEADLRNLVTLGSDGTKWTKPQKERAKTWVSCCSRLLRDEAMDAAQQSFAEEVMPSLLTEETLTLIKWPRTALLSWSQYTEDQQMLWALALVLALEDEHETERLMVASLEIAQGTEGFFAKSMLKALVIQIQSLDYDEAFRHRCLLAISLLTKLMRVEIGT